MKRKKIKYPIYKISKKSMFVVMFTGKQEGIVVKDTEESQIVGNSVGHMSRYWIEHTNTYAWEDYTCGHECDINSVFYAQFMSFIEDKRKHNMIVSIEDIRWFIDSFTKYYDDIKKTHGDTYYQDIPDDEIFNPYDICGF